MLQNGFHHRRDENGIFESVCQTCFELVARSKVEADLTAREQNHKCDPQHLVPDPATKDQRPSQK
jgi:hypothetical protein